ncbi:hypothetical protein [Streptomyces sp. MA5143a]|uniref:hypothetical protein n=1 Tax=Streptomyces sp. MA5143a TaxID=2083010 RepID=UPI000D1A82E8|nr:hypothetical protein [Streptomyces sp. MA5143a]SPF07309.1 hypothetical protein SMA5143A_8160 [Streptomyces sp. MA5143a]
MVSFDTVEKDLNAGLPVDLRKVCSFYGDLLISDYFFIFGQRFMVDKNVWMSDFVRGGHPVIPRSVLPDPGGMLHWGHSVEGDKFFLEHRGNGEWVVSAFRRSWGDWCAYEQPVVDWLVGVFSGAIATDWMPEWPESHWFEGQ